MKLLLVEHNVEMRRLIKGMISEFADEIYESDGGSDAIELYTAVRPDWVVLDVFRKPDNGFAVADSIIKADPEARIAFISSFTDERTRQWAKEAGGKAFFGKDDLLCLAEFLTNEKTDP